MYLRDAEYEVREFRRDGSVLLRNLVTGDEVVRRVGVDLNDGRVRLLAAERDGVIREMQERAAEREASAHTGQQVAGEIRDYRGPTRDDSGDDDPGASGVPVA